MFSAALRHASPGGPTDRELLAKFATDRDEEVFAELVRRHGPVVLAVCRRVTGHIQDAEDAFQAAFLVLARRAGQVARPELLGNWLYGVAVRTALEARTARRGVKEQQPVSVTPEPVAPTPPDNDPDLRRVIDEELARLPEKYRTAVVLCDIEGLSRKDAAGRLRVPEGTLSSRLAHARKILAQRLTQRGIVTSVGAVASVFGREANATTISTDLVQLTARAAARFAPGGVVPPDIVSTRVTTLTEGVIKTMIVNRLRLMTGTTVVVLGMLGLVAAAVIGQNAAPAPRTGLIPAETTDPLANGKPSAKSPGKIPAKGIEDDDVPYPAVPQQAVARLEDGRVIVRHRVRGYKPTAGPNTGYQLTTAVSGQTHDAADVSVFDMKGNRVATKVWKEKLREDQHVLVAFDGRLPHPRELGLFKDDVLLIVFLGQPGLDAPATPGFRTNFVQRSYYEPVQHPDGTISYVLRTTYQPVPSNPPAPDANPSHVIPGAPPDPSLPPTATPPAIPGSGIPRPPSTNPPSPAPM
jgi:RNA polymerase sigma factor (sigma-70 family)